MIDWKSEIRESIIRELLEKCRKNSFEKFLLALKLVKIRQFEGAEIRFGFPVTALIGPNGAGKSTILGASACAYANTPPESFFRKSRIADEHMDNWTVQFEVIDRNINQKGTVSGDITYSKNHWRRVPLLDRHVKFLSLTRTVPTLENPLFNFRTKLSVFQKDKVGHKIEISSEKINNIGEAAQEIERILGKSLANFELHELAIRITKSRTRKIQRRATAEEIHEGKPVWIIDRDENGRPRTEKYNKVVSNTQKMYVGSNGGARYSEFNFGSGEASVIRMVADIESLPDHSLVLIEEIENGLHPLAVQRMVEYLIDVARRKKIQSVFTTHSDYALMPLPSDAIWASVDGRLQQGKLSVESLRAISGRIDKKLAIFVEDEFAKAWLEAILRDGLGGNRIEEVGIYSASGDGNAVQTHMFHEKNPAISFRSACFIDGDSQQKENTQVRIFRLPGQNPELTVFDSILNSLDTNAALLTVGCQRSINAQASVCEAVRKISRSNRDPHLLFAQVGMELGFISEIIVRGAFFALWINEHRAEVNSICSTISELVDTAKLSQVGL